MLIDMLSRQSSSDLATAATGVRFNRFEDMADPKSWRLVNLITVARKIVGRGDLEPPQALREWRNTIHPAVCLQNYLPDKELGPEVRTAAGMFETLLRDLP